MSVFGRVLCVFGRHCGQWSSPGGRCEMDRVCAYCGKSEELTRHTWSPFAYVADDRCEQLRRCERCGSTESQPAHVWGPWRYLNTEFNSPQVRECLRCHATDKTSYTLR
jgi:hypothetical protein